MYRFVSFALLTLAEASLYSEYDGAHCYAGHGGTPVKVKDVAINNVNATECKATCDKSDECVAVTLLCKTRKDYHNPIGDCYLRSNVDMMKCDTNQSSKWITYKQIKPPPLSGNIMYHLFEPKFTGLGNKDAGDFKGDASFIFQTFTPNYSKGNPEASMDHNIIEMSEVNVTGWGLYEYCNAPGADGHHHCPADNREYCCTVKGDHGQDVPTNHTRMQLPGMAATHHPFRGGEEGYWFSFPMESVGITWMEKHLRRIQGRCLGNAWRQDAGGCSQCGDALDQCVAKCIERALMADNNIRLLQKTWDRVFANPNECPDVPYPNSSLIVV